MGYFSALDAAGAREDRSFPPPEAHWRARISDLRDRLEQPGKAPLSWTARFSESDLRYAPPGCFTRAGDVRKAIRLAEESLAALTETEPHPVPAPEQEREAPELRAA